MACLVPLGIATRQPRGATESSSWFVRPQPAKQSTERQHSARGVQLQAVPSSFNSPRSSTLNGLGGDLGAHARTRPFDVVGLGEAMVDYSGMVSAEYLEQIGIERGGRRYASRQCECCRAIRLRLLAPAERFFKHSLHCTSGDEYAKLA